MLRFSDFSHLPELDDLVGRLVAETSGLTVVAGLDNRPGGTDAANVPAGFLPSGRATIFRVLAGEILAAHPNASCAIVTEDRDALHISRRLGGRISLTHVRPPLNYTEALNGLSRRPALLFVDRVTPENLDPMLAMARAGTHVLSQLDTVYHAQALAHHLGLLSESGDLSGLRWVIGVQRLPALCPICKQPADVTLDQLAQLEQLGRRHPGLASLHASPDGGAFFAPGSCPNCNFTGRKGDVAAFDFFRIDEPTADIWTRPSTMPMEAYIWMLAQRGQLALSDALQFDAQQLQRTYSLLMGNEARLAGTTAALERATAQLDSANRLLNQRTRELVALEGIGESLTTWNDLCELGDRVLRTALELSKADRGALYYVRSSEWGQILTSRGWANAMDEIGLARDLIYDQISDREPMDFIGPPPGIQPPTDSPPIRAGHAIPLVAHGIPTGLMLVQSTRKAKFSPGEIALLRTLAGYAGVAMQRAALIEQLRGKIEALEAAHEELAQKERLESELEMARQVQMSMLPRAFPDVAGLTFAAAYAPARQVGGDFYDVIRLDDGRIGIVIADVADKGLPAALYMAQTRSLIHAVARHFPTPADVLHRVNDLLLELGEANMFVTVFYAVLDARAGRLTGARAGHEHPFLLRDGRVSALGGDGMALGLFPKGIFTIVEQTVELRPGDSLVFYTDGLTDIVSPDGKMSDREQLAMLAARHAEKSPDMLCRAVFDDLAAWQGDAPQFDDMALLVVGVG